MTIYPELIIEIRNACFSFEQGEMAVISFQQFLARSVDTVVAIEDKKLRQFLDDAENRIELIRFTIDANRVRAEVTKVVHAVATEIANWE